MSVFEKVEGEPIELEEPVQPPPEPLEPWNGDTFTVAYQPGKKLTILLIALATLPLFLLFLQVDSVIFEMLTVAGLAFGAWYLGDCLFTRDFTFAPDCIVKRTLFGETVVPTDALKRSATDKYMRLAHGSEENLRESVKVRRALITDEDAAAIERYHAGRSTRKHRSGQGKASTSSMAINAFDASAGSYQCISIGLLVGSAVVALFTAGASDDNFFGLAGPSLPPFTARLVCIALTVIAYFVLRSAHSSALQHDEGKTPMRMRLRKLDRATTLSAISIGLVAILGLVLFLLFGNTLDLYLFLLVGLLYFLDFYPRLTTWETTVRGTATSAVGMAHTPLRRRSLQVSLVLMGALAVMSYGEERTFLYATRKDCTDDWGEDNCQDVPGGTSSGSSHYYRPRYQWGSGRSTHAIGVQSVSRGGFGSLGRFHASFGG